MSQWELKVKTKKLPKVQEEAGDQVATGLSFHMWLVEREVWVFWTIYRAKWSKTNAIWDFFQHSIEIALNVKEK